MPKGIYNRKNCFILTPKRLEQVLKIGFKKGHKQFNTGRTWFKKGQCSGEKSSQWKGDDIKYSGLHMWVRKHLGKPDKCEHCNKSGLKGRQIHWANKSGSYLRKLEDWIRLCVSCHKKYDNKHLKEL